MRTKDLANAGTVLKYVQHLQDANTNALGFLTSSALREYHDRRQIIPAAENDELVAYALYFDGRNARPPKRDPHTFRIIQLCTDYEARRLKHATALVNELIDRAQAGRFHRLRAWVADDLPANDFWQAIGFQRSASRVGRAKSQRRHNLWILELDRNPPPPTHTARSDSLRDIVNPMRIRTTPDPDNTQRRLQHIASILQPRP